MKCNDCRYKEIAYLEKLDGSPIEFERCLHDKLLSLEETYYRNCIGNLYLRKEVVATYENRPKETRND